MQFSLASCLMLMGAATSAMALSLPKNKPPTTIVVTLSDNGFQPNEFDARVGDSVEFRTSGGSGSVVESAFDVPCQLRHAGFSSGMFETNGAETSRVFIVPITNNKPLAFYNGATDRCNVGGHVGVINGMNNGEQSLSDFKSKALGFKGTVENPTITRGGDLKPPAPNPAKD
ncbi:hypothetical protein CFIMG_008544RA00001 [Ceratocystis fimbriata CBS 114723]|uniref:Extracellular serine-rich protein n=1 Tax=Ceratocystis fimbriata CBS 114723 TaxID=1035309 RepID=A0A2C5X0V1_9PEZI|nr:hypothetical protein CFIMG_008544RA00001 [Ceratocystis fimbriata CBS 114723]